MMCNPGRNLRRALALAAIAASLPLSARAQFTNPSQDELKITSVAEAPGAPAIYLEREVINDDGIQAHGGESVPIPSYSAHTRIKVLTEEGKKYAEVTLPRLPDGNNFKIDDLQARTIHADGSIVAFSGQPQDRPSPDGKGTLKVFTLPDARVGSVLEYRYKLSSPALPPVSAWILPADLYTRKLHYLWKIAGKELMKTKMLPGADPLATPDPASAGRGGRGGGASSAAERGMVQGLRWATYIPKNAEINQSMQPGGIDGIAANAGMRTIDLTARDIAAAPVENDTPPMIGLLYHVVFYYSAYPDPNEFWLKEGSDWTKREDLFMKQDTALKTALGTIIGAGDPEDAKLKKIYAAVMTADNTDLAKPGSPASAASSAAQVWANKSGTSNQIAELFVALARAAGFKAYVMAVPDRSKGIFMQEVLSLDQFQDEIAIVDVGGKEQFFDPGERYCAYGHLAWQHTATRGIRQVEGGGTSNTQETPGEPWNASVTQRVADLQLASNGALSGPVTLYYTGSPALDWRQRALATDDASLRAALAVELQRMLPAGMTVQVATIDNLTSPDQKLGVHYIIKGAVSGSGGHASYPGDLFAAPLESAFTADKRVFPLFLRYSYQMQDVVRVTFPAGVSVESAPAAGNDRFEQSSEYTFASASTPTSITIRRNLTMADAIFPAAEYASLKTYYSKMEQKSHENVVLKGVSGGN